MEEPDTEMEWDEMMKRSEENNRCGNVSWILNKGLSVGKMILVTGFVISSAPVFLLPFVVVSAIGFACSVPYGLFLASYALTEQLMSKLLPASSHISLEYYGTNKNIIVDDYREDDACADQFGGDIIDMGKEGEPKLSVEVNSARGEMIFDKENDYEVPQGFWKDEKHPLDDKNNATHVDENGYEEDVEDQDHKPPSKVQQAEEEKPVIEQGREAIVGASQVMIVINEGDEGSGSNLRKKEEAPYELARSLAVNLSQDHDKDEDKERVIEMVSDVLMEKQPIQDVRGLLEKKDFGDSTKGGAQGNVAYVKQNLQLIREKELVVTPPNEDAREIADESGLDLFDDKQAVGPQCSYADYRIPEGSEQLSYKAYVVTLPTTVDDSKCTGITSENDIHLAAGNVKVLYSEDKIWKQIRAVRTIVGYKASVRGTCIEELKALYIFTGVEPPASFRDPSDLAEVNDKLKFLMTIVGVK
ncbi:hypothetical protein BDE02_19G050300 [Populus trichocarpa]|uniref:Uncharacterized protein n=1 Tax=Populus trichocarpa TaxID=3694 RepID=A0A2K1R8A8_POPTR|nr:hypothetical protein BDE02_19G050300 [Populus trichocarpa]|eukprot:XP_002325462.2 uncharacterized protein LOC7459213 [Populus trichocarpa]